MSSWIKSRDIKETAIPHPTSQYIFCLIVPGRNRRCESEKYDGEPIQGTIEGCVFFRAVSSHNSKRGYPTTVRSFLPHKKQEWKTHNVGAAFG